MPLYMKMSQNINKTTRHLRDISILTNLLRTENEKNSVKTLYNFVFWFLSHLFLNVLVC